MGFGAQMAARELKDTGEVFEKTLPEDLVNYGLIPEFIGRLFVVSAVHQLARRSHHDPDRAAQRPGQAVPALLLLRRHRTRSPTRRSRRSPTGAFERQTGARGLRSIIEETLLDVQFELLSRRDVKKCVVTKETIDTGRAPTLVTEAARDSLEEAPAAESA